MVMDKLRRTNFAPNTAFALTTAPKFGGYRVQNDGAWLFLPGHSPTTPKDKVSVEYRQGDGPKQTADMTYNKALGQWELPKNKPLSLSENLSYRFIHHHQNDKAEFTDTPVLDLAYTQPNATDQSNYNVIIKHSKDPESLGPILLNFPDASVNEQQLETYKALREQGDIHRYKRHYYNTFDGNETARPFINRICRQMGFVGVEDRPVIGGDALSSHGYWTNNLFQLNPRISSQSGFNQVAMDMLENGGKWFFDGAFVNEGLNGIHYLTNLYWKDQSPYLNWFDYGELNQFPFEPIRLGILPAKADPATGDDVINDAAWDIRFIPPSNGTNPESPWFVELYDPRFEDAEGRRIEKPAVGFLTNYQMSLQKYRFPIRPEEYEKKVAQLKLLKSISNPVERLKQEKAIKREWNHFIFDISATDFAANKWDGQRDVARVNMRNPQVVNYTRNAMTYWTDKVMRLYTGQIASALTQTGQMPSSVDGLLSSPQKAIDAIQAITKPALGEPGLLPALNRGEPNPITPEKIKSAVNTYNLLVKDSLDRSAGSTLTHDLAEHFRLETLPGPAMMQGLLAHPNLKHTLQNGQKNWWQDILSFITYPVVALIKLVRPKTDTSDWFRHSSFYSRLQKRLDGELVKELPEDIRKKLRDPLVGHLFHEEVGRSIFLSILTGQKIQPEQELSAAQVTKAYAQHIPSYISMAPPDLAASRMADFLMDHVDEVDFKPITNYLRHKLKDVTPQGALMAQLVCNERHMGAHLRVDAAKEIGDLDKVRNLPDGTTAENATTIKTDAFKKELDYVNEVLSKVVSGIRSVFPGAIVKPELTDLDEFMSPVFKPDGSVDQGAPDSYAHFKLLDEFLQKSPFDGIPNMRWFFQSYMGVHTSATKPDDEVNGQKTVADYLNERIKQAMTTLPLDKAMKFQNMTTSHDYPTAVFNMAKHNKLFRYDNISWFTLGPGKNGDGSYNVNNANYHIYLAVKELENKPQIGFLVPDVPKPTYEQLLKKLTTPEVIRQFSPEIQHLYANPYTKVTASPYPSGLKRQFVDEASRIITASELNLTPAEHQQLFAGLKAVMLEPSETKCIRGTLSNHVHDLAQATPENALIQETAKALNVPAQEIVDLAKTVSGSFDKTFWDLAHQSLPQEDRRWLGYQQLDYVIDWVTDRQPGFSQIQNAALKRAYKQVLYNKTIQDALLKMKRLAALQIAVPGDPTFYLPDLLGQAGGEDIKNMFLGNREVIRYDWLKTNPTINRFFGELGQIIRQRYEHHVLNNGSMVLPLDPTGKGDHPIDKKLNEDSVIPMIRDNGVDQALCLVNMGKPEPDWDKWAASHTSSRYAELLSSQPVKENYKCDLSRTGIAPGTVYQARDGETPQGAKEQYVVNQRRELVKVVNGTASEEGIRIKTLRVLERVPNMHLAV